MFAELFRRPEATTAAPALPRHPAIQANLIRPGASEKDIELNAPACVFGTYKAPAGEKTNLSLRAKPSLPGWKLVVPGYDTGADNGVDLSRGVEENAADGKWYWRGALQLTRTGNEENLPAIILEVSFPNASGTPPENSKVNLEPSEIWLLAGGEVIDRPAGNKEISLSEKEIQVWRSAGGAWTSINPNEAGPLARGFATRRREMSRTLPLVLIQKEGAYKPIEDWLAGEGSLLKENPWEGVKKDGAPFLFRGAVWWQGEWDAEHSREKEGKDVRTHYHKSLAALLNNWFAWQDQNADFGPVEEETEWNEWVAGWRHAHALEKRFPRLAIVQLPSVNDVTDLLEPFVEAWQVPYQNFWSEIRYAQAAVWNERLLAGEGRDADYANNPREFLYSPFPPSGEPPRGWISEAAIVSAGKEIAARMDEAEIPVRFDVSDRKLRLKMLGKTLPDGTPPEAGLLEQFAVLPGGKRPDSGQWDEATSSWVFDLGDEATSVRTIHDDVVRGHLASRAKLGNGTEPGPEVLLPAFSLPVPQPPPP